MAKHSMFLTKEGLEKLKKEYDHLIRVRRKEVTERIAKARDYGDISENSEYDSAREEQSFVEGRITELSEILKDAKVLHNGNSGVVSLGSTVLVEVGGTVNEFMIVSSVEADPMNGKISNESPVGKALLGQRVGGLVEISSSERVTYKILEIK